MVKFIKKIKNKCRKESQNYPNATNILRYKKIEHFYKKQLNLYVSENWNKFVSNLKVNDGSVWKIVKRYKRKGIVDSLPDLTNDDNELLTTNDKKVDGFAKFFSTVSKISDNLGVDYFSKKVTNDVNKFLKQNININDVDLTNYKEVKQTIKTLKNNKALGNDVISGKILKNLPTKCIVYLIKLINGIMCTGFFPTSWKIAKVIPIYKKGKDASKISSYRPISLLSHVSKIVEKIIKKRILKF